MNRRWLMIAFAVSVALNLFFFGVAAARLWHRAEWHSERRSDAALSMSRRFGGAAGGEGHRASHRGRRDPFSWMSEPERAELRSQRQALVGIRRDAERLLAAEPFDAAKFRATLEALRAQTTQIQSSVHERLLKRAEAVGPEERLELVDMSWGTPGERGRPSRHRD
jgi:uncharacterized membrane protein